MNTERCEHTLTATALVNETFLRLSKDKRWDSSGHFFSAAVETMRRVLVDHARSRLAGKRQAKRVAVDLERIERCETPDMDLILDLDEVLAGLAKEDAEAAELVRLRLFGGLSVVQAGEVMGLTRWSAYQLWDFCQAWFEARARKLRES
jgi:RNA polymerase sigma factor (TIGR02999 family)